MHPTHLSEGISLWKVRSKSSMASLCEEAVTAIRYLSFPLFFFLSDPFSLFVFPFSSGNKTLAILWGWKEYRFGGSVHLGSPITSLL